MSLILDALRKADAERERGSVPSLHSHPVMPQSEEQPPKSAARPNWLWITIGIALGLAGAAAWFTLGRDAPRTAVSGAAEPGPPAVQAPSNPAPPVAAPAPAVAAQADAASIAEPAPWRPPGQPEERKAPKDSPPAAPGPAAAAADSNIYAREQLPPDVRAAVPQLVVGGSMYSANPAARSLIVNGQLYREKDRLTQDLSLEEIRLKGAIFSFRGYRFEVLF